MILEIKSNIYSRSGFRPTGPCTNIRTTCRKCIILSLKKFSIKRLLVCNMTRQLRVDFVTPFVSNGDECPICLKPLLRSVALDCGHSYHLKCIDAWFLRQKNCPYCRRKVFLPPPAAASQQVEEVAASQQTTVCCCCFGKVLRRPSSVPQQTLSTPA